MNKPKQQNQSNSIYLKHNNKEYLIILETLKNTTSGAPRYKATITCLEELKKDYFKKYDSLNLFNYVYIFTGSHCGIYEEARQILKHALKED